MNSKDMAIGVLSVTAVVLFSALVIVQTLAPQSAMAFAQTSSSGDFLITTSQLDDTAELVVIVEAAAQRMNVYGFNVPVGQIELIQQIDLAPLQRTAAPRPAAPRR
ncbi:MAG TPA: hypothetical protein PL151_09725 [Phycisphaerae bacterium]|nr:hypothetical protein [Phycisphaerae bacterium]HOJ76177.1 hypothetical protein [Phycisphaerae bacterium]HOM53533.1 hypothetical protein [Phycisphaerae bacterium]HOQ86624.1 hypothetical protein [Phycisphaerae bacterium]HPP28802.1 hypothetical protein [Phycisphaerae bacterium]